MTMPDLFGARLLRLEIVRGPEDPVAPDGHRFHIAWSPTLQVSDFNARQTHGLVVALFKKRPLRRDVFLATKKVETTGDQTVEGAVHATAAFLVNQCGLDEHAQN
jgi:hypothetical protein